MGKRPGVSISAHLNGLDECEEEDPDGDAPPEQLDESGRAEETQEADVDHLGRVDDRAHHRDEVEGVPRVREVSLRAKIGPCLIC